VFCGGYLAIIPIAVASGFIAGSARDAVATATLPPLADESSRWQIKDVVPIVAQSLMRVCDGHCACAVSSHVIYSRAAVSGR